MSAELEELLKMDKEYSKDDSSTKRNIPKWVIYICGSYLLSLVVLFIIQPKVILELKVEDENTTKIVISKKKLAYYSLPTAALLYIFISNLKI